MGADKRLRTTTPVARPLLDWIVRAQRLKRRKKMTINDVIRLAENLNGDPKQEQELRKAIETLILEEREACAQTCIDQGAYREEIEMAHECSWAIRLRSN